MLLSQFSFSWNRKQITLNTARSRSAGASIQLFNSKVSHAQKLRTNFHMASISSLTGCQSHLFETGGNNRIHAWQGNDTLTKLGRWHTHSTTKIKAHANLTFERYRRRYTYICVTRSWPLNLDIAVAHSTIAQTGHPGTGKIGNKKKVSAWP